VNEVLCERVSPESVWLPEPLRVVKDAFLDKVRHWIEIDGSRVTSEAQGLKRDSAASSEAVKDLRWAVRVGLRQQVAQGVDPVIPDGCFEGGRLGEEVEDLLSSCRIAGVGQQGAEHDCPAHRERSPSPPQVHRRDVAVP
jgi:hypothetical protein